MNLETWATDDPEYRCIRAADEDRIRALLAEVDRLTEENGRIGNRSAAYREDERARIRAGVEGLLLLVGRGRYEQMTGRDAAWSASR